MSERSESAAGPPRKPGSLRAFADDWAGVLLVGVFAIATLWLSATGRLELYIHPRYTFFTVGLALIGLAASVAAVVIRIVRGRVGDGHEHDVSGVDVHDHDAAHAPEPSRRGRLWAPLGGAVTAVTAIALSVATLVLGPTTLSAETALARDIDATGSLEPVEVTPGVSTETFTVREWAALLAQAPDAGFFAGKPVDIVGFVVPDADAPDSADRFLVARFAVTCCALDAQPIAVPVEAAGWQAIARVDDWVRVTGVFAERGGDIVLVPTAWEVVDEPEQPYLF